MKELTNHNELEQCHGREVIVEYNRKLIQGVLSVNTNRQVYFCFDENRPRVNSNNCQNLFNYTSSRQVSHPNKSSRYESKETLTKHIYLVTREILDRKGSSDRLDKLEEAKKVIQEEIDLEKEIVKQEVLSRIIERAEKAKLNMYLVTNTNKTKLKLKYKDTTLIQINGEGLITYRRTKEALNLFQDWIDNGSRLEANNELWKGKEYTLAYSGIKKKATLFVLANSREYFQDALEGILSIEEGLGLITTDDNIKRMAHNNRAIVHY